MESHKAGFPLFPPSLEIPSGFPHSHGFDGGCLVSESRTKLLARLIVRNTMGSIQISIEGFYFHALYRLGCSKRLGISQRFESYKPISKVVPTQIRWGHQSTQALRRYLLIDTISSSVSIRVDRMFLSIWRVNKPDDPVLSMAFIGVFGASWIRHPPWHRQLDPILRNALAYQKLFDPLRSS